MEATRCRWTLPSVLNLCLLLLIVTNPLISSESSSADNITSKGSADDNNARIVKEFCDALSTGDFSDPLTAPIKFICLQRIAKQIICKPADFSELTMNNLAVYLDTCPTKPTFVVFSEYFWGNNPGPLEITEANTIKNKLVTLSKSYPHAVFFAPFLEVFDLPEQPAPRPLDQIKAFVMDDDKTVADAINDPNGPYVRNRLYIYWNGSNIAWYNKSTYVSEFFQLQQQKIFYQFGDFRSYAIDKLDGDAAKMAQLFTGDDPLVSVRICADISQLFLSKIPKSSKIIVVAGSGAPTSYFTQGAHLTLSERDSRAVIISDTQQAGRYYPYQGDHFYIAGESPLPANDPRVLEPYKISLSCLSCYAFNFWVDSQDNGTQISDLTVDPNSQDVFQISNYLFSKRFALPPSCGILSSGGVGESNGDRQPFVIGDAAETGGCCRCGCDVS